MARDKPNRLPIVVRCDDQSITAASLDGRPLADGSWANRETSADLAIGEIVAQWKANTGDGECDAIVCPASDQFHLLTWPASDFGDGVTPQAVRFAAETILPLDAESIEIDFDHAHESVVALAVVLEPLMRVVDALEDHGIRVQRIVPEVLLLAQAASRVQDGQVLLIDNDRHFDRLVIANGRPVAWSRGVIDDDALASELRVAPVDGPVLVVPRGERIDLSVMSAIRSVAESVEVIEPVDGATFKAAVLACWNGDRPPWFDLRRGELARHDPLRRHRQPMQRLAIAACGLVIVGIMTSGWQIWRCGQSAQNADAQMRDLFQRTLPGQRVPAAIIKRVRSEYTQTLGQRSVGDRVAVPESAVAVLVPLLNALPDELAVRIQSIRIRDGDFVLDADVDSYDAAGELSRRLDQSPLTVQPTTTSRRGAAVELRVQGTLSASKS